MRVRMIMGLREALDLLTERFKNDPEGRLALESVLEQWNNPFYMPECVQCGDVLDDENSGWMCRRCYYRAISGMPDPDDLHPET